MWDCVAQIRRIVRCMNRRDVEFDCRGEKGLRGTLAVSCGNPVGWFVLDRMNPGDTFAFGLGVDSEPKKQLASGIPAMLGTLDRVEDRLDFDDETRFMVARWLIASGGNAFWSLRGSVELEITDPEQMEQAKALEVGGVHGCSLQASVAQVCK